jgi:hypothetical protein
MNNMVHEFGPGSCSTRRSLVFRLSLDGGHQAALLRRLPTKPDRACRPAPKLASNSGAIPQTRGNRTSGTAPARHAPRAIASKSRPDEAVAGAHPGRTINNIVHGRPPGCGPRAGACSGRPAHQLLAGITQLRMLESLRCGAPAVTKRCRVLTRYPRLSSSSGG